MLRSVKGRETFVRNSYIAIRMRLSRQTIRAITLFMISGLLGLVALQGVLLRDAYEFHQQAFERNVHSAMNSIGQKIEATEALGDFFHVAVDSPGEPGKVMKIRIEGDSNRPAQSRDSLTIVTVHTQAGDAMPVRVERNAIHYSLESPQHVTLRVFDVAGRRDSLLVDGLKGPGEYVVRFADPVFAGGDLIVKYSAGNSLYTLHMINGTLDGFFKNSTMIGKREEIVGRIAENLAVSEREPVEKRISPALLDSIIGATLREDGITLPCVYGIVSGREDSIRMGKPAGFERALLASGFRSRLFPSDVLFSGNQLLLYFPGQTLYLLKQVGLFLALTVLFMIVIVLCFFYTIRTIIRQKQFSLRLMDFVNNMTHEFKTPISTIAVATETIARPDVVHEAEKVIRYTAVIRDENTRMKKQVDTILQMAVLEEGDYELKVSDIDVHGIIRRVADNVALQIEPDRGSIECRLEAAESVARVDAIHFTNIIHNVLDNAAKYSAGTPAIVVRTFNRNGNIAIDVTDHGIGIGEEDVAKVFEKYYRVHTGNVHDVKGFGIGLSYVKLMTEAHGGSVSIESEPGRGTTVHLIFPLPLQNKP